MRRQAITTVTENHYASLNLLQFLASRFTYLISDEWEEQIARARVLVNQKPATAKTRLQVGDVVAFLCHDLQEPDVDFSYSVIHEDEDLLVVNKPANLPCHPRGRYFRHTLWALLKEKAQNGYFSFVNRIDRETSGIVLVAKNKRAARNCQQQFISQQVEKSYIAVVNGNFPQNLCARGFLASDPGSSIRHRVRFLNQEKAIGLADPGKAACTEFRLIQVFDQYSLIAARPLSGRRHQIRATLAAYNFPIVGDKLYAADQGLFGRFTDNNLNEADKEYLTVDRQALHASRLSFRHPCGGQKLSFFAPMPDDMENLLENLPPSPAKTSG